METVYINNIARGSTLSTTTVSSSKGAPAYQNPGPRGDRETSANPVSHSKVRHGKCQTGSNPETIVGPMPLLPIKTPYQRCLGGSVG